MIKQNCYFITIITPPPKKKLNQFISEILIFSSDFVDVKYERGGQAFLHVTIESLQTQRYAFLNVLYILLSCQAVENDFSTFEL